MGRQVYTLRKWNLEDQKNYRVNKAEELARKVFDGAEFCPVFDNYFLGITLENDRTDAPFSVEVDLGANGIKFNDREYRESVKKLADLLETDERLGKFVIVKEPDRRKLGEIKDGKVYVGKPSAHCLAIAKEMRRKPRYPQGYCK